MNVIYKNGNCKICDEYVFRASSCNCGFDKNMVRCDKCIKNCNGCKILKDLKIYTLKEKNKTSIECVLCKKIKNMPCYHCNKLCCGSCFGKNTINVGLSCDMMYNLYCAECKEFNKDI